MKVYENGRSMVEMLGVLAIIGVLSVTGIYGYTLAMRKFRANEILNTANILAIMADSMDQGQGGCVKLSASDLPKPAGVKEMVAEREAGETVVKIQFDGENLTDDIPTSDVSAFKIESGETDASCSGDE